MLHADAKYIDVLERVLYNGVLSGISLQGDRFFYPNPLESSGRSGRSPWFGCACCPSNVSRFIPSVPGYAYACKDNDVYINLFIGGTATVETADNTVKLLQKTNYPWDGKVEISVEPKKSDKFALLVRIPGWAGNEVVPGDLYSFQDKNSRQVSLAVNGQPVELNIDKGFCKIERLWKAGDKIELNLPMQVRRVIAKKEVYSDDGKVALQRGPIVYCLEGVDNGGRVLNLVIPDDSQLKTEFKSGLLNGIEIITGTAAIVKRDEKGTPIAGEQKDFVAIPYYAWAHRGSSEMTVWPARIPAAAKAEPLPTIAATSKVSSSFGTGRSSINDQIEARNSNDHSNTYFHYWPHKGTTEWVQYDFKKKEKVSGVKVYWFDDTGAGECRVPKSWKVLYRDSQGSWLPVKNNTPYFVEKDIYNEARFEEVETDALRLEIQLQQDWSAGLHEWIVE
jgi:hypothetical protein